MSLATVLLILRSTSQIHLKSASQDVYKRQVKDGTVSYRLHGEQATTTVPKEEFLAMLKDEIATKKINPAALK